MPGCLTLFLIVEVLDGYLETQKYEQLFSQFLPLILGAERLAHNLDKRCSRS